MVKVGWARHLLHEGHEAVVVRGVQHVGGVERGEVAGGRGHGARALALAVRAPTPQRGRQERCLQRRLPIYEYISLHITHHFMGQAFTLCETGYQRVS
jgi:hypothetical protein